MTRPKKGELVPFAEESAERMVTIFGDQSACAKALHELRLRRSQGEAVMLWTCDDAIVVGPDPASSPSAPLETKVDLPSL